MRNTNLGVMCTCRLGSNPGTLEDLETYNDFPTTTGAGFLDFIKPFYFLLSFNCLLLLH